MSQSQLMPVEVLPQTKLMREVARPELSMVIQIMYTLYQKHLYFKCISMSSSFISNTVFTKKRLIIDDDLPFILHETEAYNIK